MILGVNHLSFNVLGSDTGGQSSFNVLGNFKIVPETLVSDIEGGQSSFDVHANC